MKRSSSSGLLPGSLIITKWIGISLLLIQFSRSAFGQDNRCFLIGGGSAETFFVSENATVGSVIGTLRIVGDPAEGGDIKLRLEANETVVSIEAGTKNLTLVKPLDKEGVSGPAQVTTRITCQRVGHNDTQSETSLTVPVNIRVTDANDNSPVFREPAYFINISESAIVSSVVLSGIEAVDGDQPGPYSTVQYSILPGTHSDVLDFSNSLEGTLVLQKSLDYESVKQFKIIIRAQDQGQPPLYSEASVTVQVLDADDQNPIFGQSRYWAHLPQPAQQEMSIEVRPEPLRAVDQDTGINASIRYAWNGDGKEYKDFLLNPLDGSVKLNRTLVDNELVQPVTLVVKAYQVDNDDRYALSTLAVSRSWSFSPQLQYLQRRYSVQVLEDIPVDTIILTLAVNKPNDENLRFMLEIADGPFRVDKRGEVKLIQSLDYESQTSHQLIIWATDGLTNDTALVNINVLDVNDWDPSFDQPEYEFIVKDSLLPVGSMIGRIRAEDKDPTDKISLQLKGPESKAFKIDDDGDITYVDPAALNSTVVHLIVIAKDNGVPPRQSSVPVKINLPVDFYFVPNGSGITLSTADSSGLLLIILGSLLGVLSLIISGLAVYLCQYKRKKNQPAPIMVAQQPKMISELYSDDVNNPPVTATLRRMPINPLARPNSRRVVPIQSPAVISSNGHHPAPPPPPLPPSPSRSADGQLTSQVKVTTDNNNESGRTVVHHVHQLNGPQQQAAVAWPSHASLPRRVKKLSWEDEFNVFF